MMPKILLVDDDPQSLESTCKILEFSGYEVITASDGQSALNWVRPTLSAGSVCDRGKLPLDFDLVITDVRMPKMGGLEFLKALSLCGQGLPVILMTAFGRVEDAVWAMKLGAVDFLTKPFKRQTLLASVESALRRSQAKAVDLSHKPSAQNISNASVTLLGQSAQMQALRSQIQQVAPTLATVLVIGESGTGKELVARCLHLQSSRAKGPMIALNCAAVPELLMESELFGYEKGSFTGALGAKEGLLEAAHGGTLFLDEIGDMPLSLQAKLLRVLQDQELRRIGATQSRKIDVRVVAATHKDLKKAVIEGKFREDLLYRLEVITLQVPPLRDRKTDLSELVVHFLGIANSRHNKQVQGVAPEAFQALSEHSWPGNVRELSNVMERAVVFSQSNQITLAELPAHLVREGNQRGVIKSDPASTTIAVPLGTSLKDVQDLLIRKTLEATDGDKNMTAKLLGINSRTIYRKLDSQKKPDPSEP